MRPCEIWHTLCAKFKILLAYLYLNADLNFLKGVEFDPFKIHILIVQNSIQLKLG